jgi:hypothetical protein
MSKKEKCILVLSDMHAPFNHPDMLDFFKAIKAKYKPTKVVCIGDEIDYHAASYHEKESDLPGAGQELKQAIKVLKQVYKLFPDVEVVESNHGSMVYRKAKTAGIPQAALKSYNDTLEAPKGWRWVFDTIVQTDLGPVYFCHGKTGTPGRLASQYGMSCVQGHFHEKAQITYISTPERLMFDAHTGCLADDKSLALGYNKVNPKRPIVSLLIIVNGIPQLIPMVLSKGGRWNRKL